MVIDTSALMAILRKEPEKDAFLRLVIGSAVRKMSAVSALEAGMVSLARRGTAGRSDMERFILDARIDVVPFDSAQARIGTDAFRRFGKGRHPARLNFGDCAAYALSKVSGEPLLFKGGDFAQTDVVPALP